MDVVGAVDVGAFLGGGVVDLGEDDAGDIGRGGGGGGGMFAEDGAVVGDACIEQRRGGC